MDSSSSSLSRSEVSVAPTVVDSFLVEALRSSRHRLAEAGGVASRVKENLVFSLRSPSSGMLDCSFALSDNYKLCVDLILHVGHVSNAQHPSVLRMELDIQKFLQNPDVLEFEFPQLPTSYHRLAAHRVAQHYGLQTIVFDDAADCLGTKILVMRTAESKFPSVKLSDIPARQPDDVKPGQIKIATRPRLSRSSSEASKIRAGNTMRTVEERIEEYERARARIFSSQGSFRVDDSESLGLADGNSISLNKEASGSCRPAVTDSENTRDLGSSSRVAIFKDTEKDRSDPDYDRSYDRYARNFPVGHGLLAPLAVPKYQAPFIQYGTAFSQSAQISGSNDFLIYGTSSDPTMTHFSSMGSNQAPSDAMYVQWPSPAMMYAHSYEQLKHTVLQVPFCQQPQSIDYSQNY